MDPLASEMSIRESAASSIGYSLTYQDIAITSVSQASASVTALQSMNPTATMSNVNAQYKATLNNLAKLGFTNVSNAIMKMGNKLNAAILDNQFTISLQANAKTNGAIGFASATSTKSATIENLSPTQSSSPPSSGNSLNNCTIVGISIAVIIFVSFVAYIVYWLLTRKTLLVVGLPSNFSPEGSYRFFTLYVLLYYLMLVFRVESIFGWCSCCSSQLERLHLRMCGV
jgi:hypothetical protein